MRGQRLRLRVAKRRRPSLGAGRLGGSGLTGLRLTSSPSPRPPCSRLPRTPSRRSSTPPSSEISVRLSLRPLVHRLPYSIWYPICLMCRYLMSPHPLLPSSRQWMPILTPQGKSHLGDELLTPIEKARRQKKVLPAVSTSLALARNGSSDCWIWDLDKHHWYTRRAGNLLNAVLDALLIFPLGLGVSGAALATVTSEYLTAFILLWKLNNEVDLFSWNIIEDGGVIRYLKSGGLLIGRTIAVFLTLTLSTSLAAKGLFQWRAMRYACKHWRSLVEAIRGVGPPLV